MKISFGFNSLKIRKKDFLIYFLPFVVIFGSLILYLIDGRYISTDDAYTQTHLVSISSKLSGPIVELSVEDNTSYKAGDSLFMIDPRPYIVAKNAAAAALENAKNDIISLKASYKQKIAEFIKAEKDLAYYQRQYDRYLRMFKGSAISDYDLDLMLRNKNDAIETMKATEESLNSVKALLCGNENIAIEDHPKYKQAKSDLEQAMLNMEYIHTKAPFNGTTANVTVRPGQYVKTGVPLFSLVDVCQRAPHPLHNFK